MVKFTIPTEVSRTLIGFDQLMRSLESDFDAGVSPSNSTYPPFNLVDKGNQLSEIQIAAAGFTADDLDVIYEDGILMVQTKPEKKAFDVDVRYIHRGIAKRAWRLRWKLLDTVEVRGAAMADGVLTISLENVIPESKKPRKIEIGAASTKSQLLNE